MALRIFTRNNYIYLRDTTADVLVLQGKKSEISIEDAADSSRVYFFKNQEPTPDADGYTYVYTDFLNGDASDAAFSTHAAFLQYASINTGFNSAGGAGQTSISGNHVFVALGTDANDFGPAETLRDTYFTTNPTERTTGLLILLINTFSDPDVGEEQRWSGTAWINVDSTLSPQQISDMLYSLPDRNPLTNARATTVDGIADLGRGSIITTAEGNKLAGIADGAEVNVNADWNAVSGDAQILNRPTDVTDLSAHSATELNDITNVGSGSIITAGERTTVSTVLTTDIVTVSEPNPNTLRFVTRGGATQDISLDGSSPSVHNFSIDIPSRVDIGTDLNVQQSITYSVTNRTGINTITLIVDSGNNVVLTAPTSDGQITQNVDLTGINTAVATTINFSVQILDNNSNTHNSNVQQVAVNNVAQTELFYWGNSATATPTVGEVSSGTTVTIEGNGQQFNIDTNVPVSEFLFLLTPTDHDITSIVETVFDQQVRDTFTITNSERMIGGINYNLYTLGPATGNPAGFGITLT